jgi:hypothetical protein
MRVVIAEGRRLRVSDPDGRVAEAWQDAAESFAKVQAAIREVKP